MTVNEVRQKYLDFFKAHGHTVIPSAPIVPENDPTTLFTGSGMQPLVPYLLGQPHPEGARLADSQISFRAEDIEEVGDNRHTTFFEMLGNWSLGDYWKKEQIEWMFDFLVNQVGIDPEKLYVTCFIGAPEFDIPKDTEAAETWQRLFSAKKIKADIVDMGSEADGYRHGMKPGERIFYYDGKKNWWNRGKTGPRTTPVGDPCGPDSEMFYDFGTPHDPKWGEHCHPNCDCGRFMEIGNNVFMAYRKVSDEEFKPLEKLNIDHGSGLERIASAVLDTPDVFLIDVFSAARNVLEKRSAKKYGDADATRSFRIILDHLRAATFMLASGITPGNSEQGYVLRRLIRRSLREADKLGIKDVVLAEVAEGYGDAYGSQYPFVKEAAVVIREEISKEEAQFRKTLERGLKEFNWRLDSYIHGADGKRHFESSELPSSIVFELVTTYGFPFELVEEEARARGMSVDKQQFANRMEAHRIKSREGAAQKFAGGLADHAEQTVRYHTAHHLLLKALQMVLGPEVHQRGSNITSERLRIDFSYSQKMTKEQIVEVEQIVNQKIEEGLPVVRTDMPKAEAEKLGAEYEFGATYPDQVSVYSVGPLDNAFSIEFCGGPHVSNTSELGAGGKKFKIQKEEASSAGVRRIKAVLE